MRLVISVRVKGDITKRTPSEDDVFFGTICSDVDNPQGMERNHGSVFEL